MQSNLSGAAFTGERLWVAGDEACGLDRLRRLGPVGREVLRFGEVRDFPLADLLDPRGAATEEADLDGLAVDGCRRLLGLRGPVLRGRSALLKVDVEARGDELRPLPLDAACRASTSCSSTVSVSGTCLLRR